MLLGRSKSAVPFVGYSRSTVSILMIHLILSVSQLFESKNDPISVLGLALKKGWGHLSNAARIIKFGQAVHEIHTDTIGSVRPQPWICSEKKRIIARSDNVATKILFSKFAGFATNRGYDEISRLTKKPRKCDFKVVSELSLMIWIEIAIPK